MATLAVLADAASATNQFIDVFIWVYILLIFVYVLTSWVPLPYSPWVRRVSDFLRDVCEPYLRIFRRVLPGLGPLDLSPIVAVLALIVVMRVIDELFNHFS
jgi:YggT family protein